MEYSLEEVKELILRHSLLGLETNIDGWIYEVYNDKLKVIGFDKDIYDKYSHRGEFVYEAYFQDIIFDFQSIEKYLRKYANQKYARIYISFIIKNLYTISNCENVHFINKLYLPDTVEISEKCFLNSSFTYLQADKVTKLGKKCFCGCSSIHEISLKSMKYLNLDDIENLRYLSDLTYLTLAENYTIPEDYYKLKNSRANIFSLLNLKEQKKISREIFVYLYKNKCVLNLPLLEEIIGESTLNKGTSNIEDLDLPKLKVVSEKIFQNIYINKSVFKLDGVVMVCKNGFDMVVIKLLSLNNCVNLSESAFNCARIESLSLLSMKEINLDSFVNTVVEKLYISKECKINEDKDYVIKDVFHEIYRV